MFYSTKVVLQMTPVIGEYIVIEKDRNYYAGRPDALCGPTAAQNSLQANSQTFSQSMMANYSQLFGQQQDTLRTLNGKLSQISTGQQGNGFSGAENAANIAGITNNAAAVAKNADQATMDAESGQGGGGTSGIRSGVNAELKAQTATGAADTESNELQQNTLQSAAVGRSNAAQTAGGLQALAGTAGQSAAASASGSNEANKNSYGEATQNQEESEALAKDVAGGLTSIAGAALSGGLSSLGGGGGSGPSVDTVMDESDTGNAGNDYITGPSWNPNPAPAMQAGF